MEPQSTVLIVDDNAADRALFRAILGRGGYSVIEVSRGRDAVEKAKESRPHLVVLDVNLPDLDGFEVCKALRADPLVTNVPVLMLTVRHDDRDVVAGLEAGADDYVAKDSAPELVLARARRLIRYRQLMNLAMLNRQLVQVGRLLAGIVHEIRGPLSVIRGSAELLRMSLPESTDDLQWVDAILRSTQLLQVRLEHLMATVRTGPPQIRPVEVLPLMQEAVELFVKGLPTETRRIAFECSCEGGVPRMMADGGRLIQVLLDLLSNANQAISLAGKGGRIILKGELADDGACRWVKVAVLDDGPGIPVAYLGRIFEPFFTTKEGGTGYGLHLASELLEEQGGRLVASNTPSGGACFTLWVPAEAEFENESAGNPPGA